MATGKSPWYKHQFLDPRHKLIYDTLIHLQTQVYLPDTELLIQYFEEFNIIGATGGAAYVRGIFRGVVSLRGRHG
jgi:replicative DNA helicase